MVMKHCNDAQRLCSNDDDDDDDDDDTFSSGPESLLTTYCVLITTRLFCNCTMLQNCCQLMYSCEWH